MSVEEDIIVFKLPDWGNWVIIEWDNTIHIHRYDPKDSASGKKFTSAGQTTVIGKLISARPKPTKFKIPALLKEEARYMGSDLEIRTASGQTYKDFTMDVLLTDGILDPIEGGK